MKNKITAITLATMLSLSATAGSSHAATFGDLCAGIVFILTFGQVDSC